jgi:hypothetical protein
LDRPEAAIAPQTMILEITWTSVLILLFTRFWARQGHLVDLGTDRYIGQKTKDIYLKI